MIWFLWVLGYTRERWEANYHTCEFFIFIGPFKEIYDVNINKMANEITEEHTKKVL